MAVPAGAAAVPAFRLDPDGGWSWYPRASLQTDLKHGRLVCGGEWRAAPICQQHQVRQWGLSRSKFLSARLPGRNRDRG